MKKYLLFISLFIHFANIVNAQNVTGQIIRADGQPLEFANVVLLQILTVLSLMGPQANMTELLPCHNQQQRHSSVCLISDI